MPKIHRQGQPVFIVDGSRTPFLKYTGSPGPFKAIDLALKSVKPLLLRQPFDRDNIDEVIVGCVAPAADELNIARLAALRAGIGHATPAWTVQRNCASGLQSLDCAFRNIAFGFSELVLAGGVEAMSHSPVFLNDAMVVWLSAWQKARTMTQRLKLLGGLRPSMLAPVIGLMKGLRDPVVGLSMGQTAENLAHRFNIGREQMDTYALQSHKRLLHAQEHGLLDEIEVIFDRTGHYYGQDDGIRADSSMESLAKLKPVFDKPFGNVSAGNSAQITDGAAWTIVASEAAVTKFNLPVLGRIVDSQWAGVDPAQMGLGPAHAVVPLLQRNDLALDQIDYWEINEAFAAQVLACVAAWKDQSYCKQNLGLKGAFGEVAPDRLNVDGGGIALGHPVGASGTRIVLHLLKVMQRQKAKWGVASLCIGGGQGGALLLENLSGR